MTEHIEQGDFDRDDDLRAVLRGGDPVGALSPADPAALESLLEDIMSADLDVRPATPGPAEPRRRTRVTWLVAAAAVAVIAAGGAFAVNGLSGNDAKAPQADQQPPTTASTAPTLDANAPLAGQTTSLTVSDQQGRCAVAQPEILAQYSQAFAATVTAIDGDTVTLQATDVFNGAVGETVQVTAPADTMDALLGTVKFKVGGSYLVAADDGQLSLCYSGAASGDLASPFQKAFVH